MKVSLTRKYFGIAFLLSLVICITIHFPLVLGVLFESDGGHRRESFDVGLATLEFLNTFLVAFLVFTLNFYLLKPFSRHQKMNIRTISLAVFLTFLSVLFLGWIYNVIKPFVG